MNNFSIQNSNNELQIKFALNRTPIVIITFFTVFIIALFCWNAEIFSLEKVLKLVLAYFLICAIIIAFWWPYRSHHFKIEDDAVIFNHKKRFPKYALCGVKLTNVRSSGGRYKIELQMHAPVSDYTIHLQIYEDDAKKIGAQIASFFEIPLQIEEK